MKARLRFGTRTIGAGYLAVGGATAAGAALGGGTVAVVWAATCGVMGVAWLAPTDASVRAGHVRLPRPGFRHRDVPFTDIAQVQAPHVWAVDPVARLVLHDGTRLPLRGLSPAAVADLAAAAGVPLTIGARPTAHPAA